MSSIQENKFLCLIKLSYDISLKVTRAYTEINILSKYDNRVSTFLKYNKHDIFHLWSSTPCCQCVCTEGTNSKTKFPLTLRQIEILFEFQGNGKPGHFKKEISSNKVIQHCLCRMHERSVSLNDFDINLLETLIKKFANLEMDDMMWLSTIREIRNCIAHVTSTTEFDAGRLDKWWMKLEGSILGLVKKVPPAFYGEAIESQINALNNSSMEAIYAKKLMEDVKAENMILLQDLVERSDIRIGDCENNIKQAITENNNVFKRYFDEMTGIVMRKFEELNAKIEASAKLDPNTYFRSDNDITRTIHVACQVEADDIDEHLTIKKLSSDLKIATENGDGSFKIVAVTQKCILLELTASPELLRSEDSLLKAIEQLIKKVMWAGKPDTRLQGKMNLKLTFTNPLTRDELAVFYSVFCTSDRAAILDSENRNQMSDYNIGREPRETEIQTAEENMVDSSHSKSYMKHQLQMQQEIKDLQMTVHVLRKDKRMILELAEKEVEKNRLKETKLLTLTNENQRKHQTNQMIQDLCEKLKRLRNNNDMLSAMVDDKNRKILSLETELKSLIKEKKRFYGELWDELKDKCFLTDQSQNTLNRSKSLCDLRHSEEKIKLLSKITQHISRDTKGQQQLALIDQAERLYDRTEKSIYLQSGKQTVTTISSTAVQTSKKIAW